MIQVERAKLDGVLLITPDVFEDHRGRYVEIYNEELYKKHGVGAKFIQDDISVSFKGVLRGIHGDSETWKLISCLHGEFLLAVVNWDSRSPQFKQWQMFELSAKNRLQVLVPPKFGNGHLVLSPEAIFHYKQTTYYNRAGQFTLQWNDPQLKINWPINNPILSKRDGA